MLYYIFNQQYSVIKCSTYPEQEIGTKIQKFWGKVWKTPFSKAMFPLDVEKRDNNSFWTYGSFCKKFLKSPQKLYVFIMIRRKCSKIVDALSNYLKVFAELFSKSDPPEAAFY